MSYSRWITSDYYTYWCSSPGCNIYDRGDELFAVHASLDVSHLFTYTECKLFIEDPMTIRDRIKDVIVSDKDLDELTMYMKKFIEDVDLSYDRKLINLRGGQ